MGSPRIYPAGVRYVSLTEKRDRVHLSIEVHDPTVKHGRRPARVLLTAEEARRWAEVLNRYADAVVGSPETKGCE